ncbi:alpha/beta fold hydrolase [Streptomyces sp. NPDC094448]|uniref:alpha/beta fold hydrolase n=1 Tax=Streptomyces sp. NPDC094448 TaxID=3366063 RepID=UPI0037F93D4D
MTIRRRQVTSSDGTTLAVTDFGGEGPGILLLHGMMGRANTWSGTVPWLTRHGRVVAYDARGHGFSDAPAAPYDRSAHVADAIAVIEALDLAPAVLIGHSMGSVTSWQLAGRRPELAKALVLGDMAAVVADTQENWKAWMADWPVPFQTLAEVREYFGGDSFARFFSGHQPEHRPHGGGDYFTELFTERPDGHWPLATRETMLACRTHWNGRDHSHELDTVECPALVVAGEHSYFPAEGQRAMTQRLTGGEFALVPDAGHILHYDNPTAWREAVEPYIAGIVKSP